MSFISKLTFVVLFLLLAAFGAILFINLATPYEVKILSIPPQVIYSNG